MTENHLKVKPLVNVEYLFIVIAFTSTLVAPDRVLPKSQIELFII